MIQVKPALQSISINILSAHVCCINQLNQRFILTSIITSQIMGATQQAGTQSNLQLEHPILKNNRCLQNQSQKYLRSSVSCDEDAYQKWKSQLQKIDGQSHKYQCLLLPKHHSFQNGGVCSTNGEVTIDYQYYPRLLSQEIQIRSQHSNHFSESEISHLMSSLIQAKNQSHFNQHQLGDIRPENIFANTQSQIKISNLLSWPNQVTNYKKTINSDESTFLSPEDLERMSFGHIENTVEQQQTSEIFSIGLTLLSSCILINCKDIYLIRERALKQKLLKERIFQLENKKLYSKNHLDILKSMLEINPQKRIKREELNKILQNTNNAVRWNKNVQGKNQHSINNFANLPQNQKNAVISESNSQFLLQNNNAEKKTLKSSKSQNHLSFINYTGVPIKVESQYKGQPIQLLRQKPAQSIQDIRQQPIQQQLIRQPKVTLVQRQSQYKQIQNSNQKDPQQPISHQQFIQRQMQQNSPPQYVQQQKSPPQIIPQQISPPQFVQQQYSPPQHLPQQRVYQNNSPQNPVNFQHPPNQIISNNASFAQQKAIPIKNINPRSTTQVTASDYDLLIETKKVPPLQSKLLINEKPSIIQEIIPFINNSSIEQPQVPARIQRINSFQVTVPKSIQTNPQNLSISPIEKLQLKTTLHSNDFTTNHPNTSQNYTQIGTGVKLWGKQTNSNQITMLNAQVHQVIASEQALVNSSEKVQVKAKDEVPLKNEIESKNYIRIEQNSKPSSLLNNALSHSPEKNASKLIESKIFIPNVKDQSQWSKMYDYHTYIEVVILNCSFEECWQELLNLIDNPLEYMTCIQINLHRFNKFQENGLKYLTIRPGTVSILQNKDQAKILFTNEEKYSKCKGQILAGVYKDQDGHHRIWFNSAYTYKEEPYPSKAALEEFLNHAKNHLEKHQHL